MREFRVTLPALYSSPTSPGHADPSARMGHYHVAEDPRGAAVKCRATPWHGDQVVFDVEWPPFDGTPERIELPREEG